MRKCYAIPMPLCPPFSLRLTLEQIKWLDQRSGDKMSRSTALRLLVHEAMRQQRDATETK